MALYDNRLDDAEKFFQQLALNASYKDRATNGLREIAMRRGSDGSFRMDNPAARAEIPFDASKPFGLPRLG
jgi:hypothetical protein